MSLAQALWLAVLQGISELFPISSIGHTVLVPRLIGWDLDQTSPTFLPFLVMLHLGTAGALLLFFWRDWLAIIAAWLRSVVRGKLTGDPDEHLAWMLVAGTVPTGILGFFLESRLKALFAAPTLAAIFLFVNGFIMLAGERLRRRSQSEKRLDSLTWPKAALIGLAQSAALIPGISRSGSTIVASLLAGLSHEAAARFSFLLATPVILAAGLLEVPLLFGPDGRAMLGLALIGGLVAAITAFLSVKFLMRYFEFGRLDPFAYYCWAFGALALIILSTRR
jgi:undecaprenyl-diphosphatase